MFPGEVALVVNDPLILKSKEICVVMDGMACKESLEQSYDDRVVKGTGLGSLQGLFPKEAVSENAQVVAKYLQIAYRLCSERGENTCELF